MEVLHTHKKRYTDNSHIKYSVTRIICTTGEYDLINPFHKNKAYLALNYSLPIIIRKHEFKETRIKQLEEKAKSSVILILCFLYRFNV